MKLSKQEIRDCIIQIAEQRAPDGSMCPSEAAKALDPDNWRTWMSAVHEQAAFLSKEGRIRLSQKGKEKKADQLKGPYRISIINE